MMWNAPLFASALSLGDHTLNTSDSEPDRWFVEKVLTHVPTLRPYSHELEVKRAFTRLVLDESRSTADGLTHGPWIGAKRVLSTRKGLTANPR
jgi:hypothetical protein